MRYYVKQWYRWNWDGSVNLDRWAVVDTNAPEWCQNHPGIFSTKPAAIDWAQKLNDFENKEGSKNHV